MRRSFTPPLAAVPVLILAQTGVGAQLCPTDADVWLPWPAPSGRNIIVESDRMDLGNPDVTLLQGDVVLRDAEQELSAAQVRYLQDEERVLADGSVRYRTDEIFVAAERADVRLDSESGRLDEVFYRLREGGGRGRAEHVTLQGVHQSLLADVSYTTCLDPEDPDWQLRARELHLDYAEGTGSARGMQLRFKNLPVLYLPYASFPLDDRRKSGLLYPSLGSSNDDGLDLSVPYYWNIAPNMDATITPRLISDRGAMLGVEYRYLAPHHAGELSAQYLPEDDRTGRHRALGSYRHSGRLSDRLRLDVDLNHVSDEDFFEDFGDSLSALSRSYLRSNAALTLDGSWWRASLSADAFEITDERIGPENEPFDRLPRLRFHGLRPLVDRLEFGLDAELAAFDGGFGVEGARLDLHPRLQFPVRRPGYYLNPAIGVRHTAYDLDRLQNDRPSRTTPIASIEGGLFFERDLGRGYQTLEPRFHYLYVPFESQSALPVFDAQELTFGFGQLFRTNRFSGADRQADANQLALAATTRVFSPDGREKIEASVGTIAYFRDQKVQLPGEPAVDPETSAVVGEVHYRPSDFWRASLGFEYDPEDSAFDQTLVSVQRRGSDGLVLNLGYRRRDNLVRQFDASFLAPVGDRWKVIGRANYSFRDDTDLETLLGFEYESCCWAARMFLRRHLRNQQGEHRNGIYLEFELKGLGSFGRSTGQLLQRAILGYRSAAYGGL